MAQTAAHLVDHIIPRVPVRQWVISLPISLRSIGVHLATQCVGDIPQLLLKLTALLFGHVVFSVFSIYA